MQPPTHVDAADFAWLLAAWGGGDHGAWSNLVLMIQADLRRLARRAGTPDRDVDEGDAMGRGKVENPVAPVMRSLHAARNGRPVQQGYVGFFAFAAARGAMSHAALERCQMEPLLRYYPGSFRSSILLACASAAPCSNACCSSSP